MDEQNVVFRLVEAFSCALHQTRKGLAGVAGIQHDALQLHHHLDGFVALLRGDGKQSLEAAFSVRVSEEQDHMYCSS